MKNSILSIVVPCFNEEEVLPTTHHELSKLLDKLIKNEKISNKSAIIYVDDGSKDKTWHLISELNSSAAYACGIKLAKNAGHQNAVMAGLMEAAKTSDMIVSIDADLQDDVNVIEEMVDKYHEGFDIVYGVRSSRESDTFFKRNTALAFYKLMHVMGVKTVYNHADFRLMSKRAVEELDNYKERNLFLRGIVPLIGYNSTSVYYERHERFAGESKYPLKKMLNFALEGITSFSVTPIRFITSIGFIIAFVSIFAAIYSLVSYFTGNVTSGWTSLILSIWFIGGVQLLSIGLVGEYIGKIYTEVKRRPRYNIETILNKDLE
ncbi:glycosyltransferase family 2 protein [Clostridium sp. 'White wine YQ']|uniref:glycosyltransferase family 2 protein n=1 Tax=Clostridium sp. 'White wine YQ' TaxID=3027474 RepID=UPI002365E555|nr:glycosyltransferase family 2 protein [Clostridium sp. 'White wine YQ']MDD7796094.1 glycosyltransferase family 2 protein [Clostridium sp. 'White wine YQ']